MADVIIEGVMQVTGIPMLEWVTLICVLIGVGTKTWVGYEKALKKNPNLVFDTGYIVNALVMALTTFLLFISNPPQLLHGNVSILIYCITCFLFAYGGNETLNRAKPGG